MGSHYGPIADFGALYDAVPIYAGRGDVPFYLSETARSGGAHAAVLELGCGTGRVLLPFARAGHVVMGIDASSAMLARCREKLAAEPQAVQDRVALVEADIRDFRVRVPPGFSFALAPFRVLQHLTTTADQLRCLESVRAHLGENGRFAFDVFNPHFGLMTTDRSAEAEDTPELALGDGRFLRRTTRVTRIRWVDQISEVELIYYVRTGSEVERIVQRFAMRWYMPSELEHLLGRAGFRVEAMYGDFERNSLTDASTDIVIVAARDDSRRGRAPVRPRARR